MIFKINGNRKCNKCKTAVLSPRSRYYSIYAANITRPCNNNMPLKDVTSFLPFSVGPTTRSSKAVKFCEYNKVDGV